MEDIHKTEKKWQRMWQEDHTFEPEINIKKKKFFLTFPYPYINAYSHVGHLYTIMRTEAFARYKRLKGFNVLFPQGWHATGSPIIQAAKRVKEREEKQIKIMKDMGFTEKDFPKFEKPEYWIKFFMPEFKKDYETLGLSIDWRRNFHTTSLNPHYNKFIEWQFRKLKEKGYCIKGKFPVVWDPKENFAVGDHDRIEGEGETPQEFLLLKHKLGDGRFILSATLRSDTCMGTTNLYVNPEHEYVSVKYKNETWIISKKCAEHLIEQGTNLVIGPIIKAIELIGQRTTELNGHKIIVLPATFLDLDYGTGIVHSCPSESADDLISLKELQKDEALLKKYNLDQDEIKKIRPITVLKTEGYSDIPAQDFLDKYNITSPKQKKELELVKKNLYKVSFHSATFNDKYKTFFSIDLEGKKVSQYQKLIDKEIISKGWGVKYYQLTGKVISRSLAQCIVKIVDDQWFLDYGNVEWKKLTHQCLDNMKIYPEKTRTLFDYVIDWLHEWACTREGGLGTNLPWDKKWLIESLSDSTIYMAYYTIAHIIKNIDPEHIDDNFFDSVFLDKHTETKVERKIVDKSHQEFNYWYPLDFRNSGKDLIQNHLTFAVFNHVAIFPKKHWPKSFGVNGWVTVDGQKMSKSLGNMIMLKDMVKQYGADASRFTILNGGESLDDPNWDSELARTIGLKLKNMATISTENYGKGRNKQNKGIDEWFESRLNESIKIVEENMEETLFRTALQKIFFEMNQNLRWYLKRTNNNPSKKLINMFIEAQIIMLSPICPHICEELWEKIGKKGFISLVKWPEHKTKLIDIKHDYIEDVIKNVLGDIQSVQKLAKLDKISKISLYIAESWKYDLFTKIADMSKKTKNPKEIIGEVMKDKKFANQKKNLAKTVIRVLKSGFIEIKSNSKKDKSALDSAKEFFESEFRCDVEIIYESKTDNPKAKSAQPAKPAIVLE